MLSCVEDVAECPGCGALVSTVETVPWSEELADGTWFERDIRETLRIRFQRKAEGGYVGFDLITGTPYHECFRDDSGGGGSGDRAPRPSTPPPADEKRVERELPRD
jgi:hypothetical protein